MVFELFHILSWVVFIACGTACICIFAGEFYRTQSGLSQTSSGYDSRSSMQRAEPMLSEYVTLELSMFKDLFMFDLIQVCRVWQLCQRLRDKCWRYRDSSSTTEAPSLGRSCSDEEHWGSATGKGCCNIAHCSWWVADVVGGHCLCMLPDSRAVLEWNPSNQDTHTRHHFLPQLKC